jgi:hypothetical protein
VYSKKKAKETEIETVRDTEILICNTNLEECQIEQLLLCYYLIFKGYMYYVFLF